MILRSFSSFLSFLIHSHSHPLTSSHLCLNFITWITVCTNEQIYWYCLTSFFKKGYMLYSFVLCPLHLKINLENYSMPVIEIFTFAAAMEHLTRLRVCTYKLMRMTNCIFDCDDSSYSNQNTVPHDLLPEFFSPSCLHESENTQCLSLSFLSVLCLALVILFLAVSSCSGWSGFRPVVSRSDLSRWFLTLPISVSPPAPFVTLTPPGQQPDSRPLCQSPREPHRLPTGSVALLWHPDLARQVRSSWVHSRFIFRSWLLCCTHSLLAKYLGCCPICRRRLGFKF